eukprot:TRINITY_DN33818_c0_g1_i1.p1 TRINITY_DN33818_c0_g1~~TRINITY_DN33818_c0_g1_i1.p1  ORF type:complete len:206 (+),score=34.94 TRINITY_DN33818_c0_g1_i1:40-657(+)
MKTTENLKKSELLSEVAEVKAKVAKQRKDVKNLTERLGWIQSEWQNTEKQITEANKQDHDLEVIENELVVRMIHASFEHESAILTNKRLQQAVTQNRQLNSKNDKIIRQNKGRYKELETANTYKETTYDDQQLQLRKLEEDIEAAERELETRRHNLQKIEEVTKSRKASLSSHQQDAINTIWLINHTLEQVRRTEAGMSPKRVKS